MRINDLLRTIDLFEQLSSDELDQLSRRMHERRLQPGEVVCRSGDAVEAMFIVLSGCVELALPAGEGRPPTRHQLTAGDSMGEIALLSGEPHAATATAIGESRVLVLARDDFEALVAGRPALMRTMLAAVSRRATQTNRRLLTEQPTSTATTSSGQIYAVFSPRGGAGKTTLATRLATHLAELMPQRVSLFDLDLVFDDAALELNLSPTTSLANIAERDLEHLDPRMLNEYLTDHPTSLRVLVGATSPEQGELVTATHVRAALAALKRQFLVTLIDCAGTFTEPTLAALESADRVLVVCTPDLASLRDLRDCQRVFDQALHLDNKHLFYVFNHPLPVAGLTRQQFESAFEQPMAVEIPHAGEAAAKAGFSRAIDQLVRELHPAKGDAGDAWTSAEAVSSSPDGSRGNRLVRLLRGRA